MRKSRSIRNRVRRAKKPIIELDITSLLDILVILLVFLLRSYNSSGVVLNVPQGISLPNSVSSSPSNTGVIVQVSPSKIWIDDEVVLDSSSLPSKIYDHGGRRIIPLYNKLVTKREEFQEIAKRSLGAKKFSGVINLVIDKSLKYNYLKKLMYTCAEAGFRKYKFVVMGEEG